MEYGICICLLIANKMNLLDNDFFTKFVPKYISDETNQDC